MRFILATGLNLLAVAVEPLIDPALTRSFHTTPFGNGEFLRVRGVKVYDQNTDTFSLHVDVFNGTDGGLLSLPKGMRDQLTPITAVMEISEEEKNYWRQTTALSRRFRKGLHPAVHCQVDEELSIAEFLRSGFLLNRLFEALYQHKEWNWTYQGISVGAAVHEGEEDPMDTWMRVFANKVLLVDPDEEGLARATGQLELQRRENGFPDVIALTDAAHPLEIEFGKIGEFIKDNFGKRVDVIKIDIDSYDCQVLDALLSIMEAAIIVLESQPLVPPPFKFARLYHPEDKLQYGLHGCSLSYQIDMLRPKYELLVYTEHDAVFVNAGLTEFMEDAQPSSIMLWSSYPLRFPVDEMDCFRRSRHLKGVRECTNDAESKMHDFPVDFVREWAYWLHPVVGLGYVHGNLTAIRRSVEPNYDFSTVRPLA